MRRRFGFQFPWDCGALPRRRYGSRGSAFAKALARQALAPPWIFASIREISGLNSVVFLHRFDAVAGSSSGRRCRSAAAWAPHMRRHDRRAGINGGGADLDLVRARRGAAGRVDDQLDFLVLEQVDRVGPAFLQLVNALHLQPRLFQNGGRAAGGDQFKAQFGKLPAPPPRSFSCARR